MSSHQRPITYVVIPADPLPVRKQRLPLHPPSMHSRSLQQTTAYSYDATGRLIYSPTGTIVSSAFQNAFYAAISNISCPGLVLTPGSYQVPASNVCTLMHGRVCSGQPAAQQSYPQLQMPHAGSGQRVVIQSMLAECLSAHTFKHWGLLPGGSGCGWQPCPPCPLLHAQPHL